MKPQGFRHAIGAILGKSPRRLVHVGFLRERDRSRLSSRDVDRLDSVPPHIRRAIQPSCRLETALAASSRSNALLGSLETPAFIVNRSCQVIDMNAAAETLLCSSPLLQVRSGVLSIAEPAAQRACRLIPLHDALGHQTTKLHGRFPQRSLLLRFHRGSKACPRERRKRDDRRKAKALRLGPRPLAHETGPPQDASRRLVEEARVHRPEMHDARATDRYPASVCGRACDINPGDARGCREHGRTRPATPRNREIWHPGDPVEAALAADASSRVHELPTPPAGTPPPILEGHDPGGSGKTGGIFACRSHCPVLWHAAAKRAKEKVWRISAGFRRVAGAAVLALAFGAASASAGDIPESKRTKPGLYLPAADAPAMLGDEHVILVDIRSRAEANFLGIPTRERPHPRHGDASHA